MILKIQLILKRLVDVLLSLIGLVLLAIPFAAIAVAIKLDSKGPVFFRQERVGKDGKKFKIFKFRTMIVGAESIGTGIRTSPDDLRITFIGRCLRLLGLDELPQLLNVLKCEMSLVGPRPTVPEQVAAYGDFERQRLLMKPGITGLPIIRGRNRLSWPQRIKLDVEYVLHWSLWLDVRILLLTPWQVLVKTSGVYRPEEGEKDGETM